MVELNEYILNFLKTKIAPYEKNKDSRIAGLNEFIGLYEPKMIEDKYKPTILNWAYLIKRVKELANGNIDPFIINLKPPLSRARNFI